jgi:hypothetical protein
MLVDDEGASRPPDNHNNAAMQQVPDRAIAEAWWQTRAQTWGDERRIEGAPLEAAWLIHLARKRVGDALTDLLDLLALKLKRPLGIGTRGWTALRCQRLQALESPPANPTTGAKET